MWTVLKSSSNYRNLRVLYEALQPDEQLRDYVLPYAWLTKLYMLYRKKFYLDARRSVKATEEDAARTRELIREHIDVDELEAEFPTYVLDEHFPTKLKNKNPDVKALDIEAMLRPSCEFGWIKMTPSIRCRRNCNACRREACGNPGWDCANRGDAGCLEGRAHLGAARSGFGTVISGDDHAGQLLGLAAPEAENIYLIALLETRGIEWCLLQSPPLVVRDSEPSRLSINKRVLRNA